ncbi:MAG: hypothetical protein KIT84_01815 [Labilithrix sp.]|nr:hypothetical protein [Labilithrix sp.]MCW5809724.1 hypothetical protein [Labilithrix sp.]
MRLAAVVLALLTALPATAHAQKKKPKRPKKPRTEQPRPREKPPRAPRAPHAPHAPREKPDDEGIPSHADAPDRAPARIDTDLEERDAPRETNPWVASGTARPRDAEAGAADKGADAPKRASDWVSRPVLVGAYGGYASENYRIGFGARAGYAIQDTFYVGAAFTYQLGVIVAGIKYAGFYPAAEGGYDWHFQSFTLRPYVGLGLFFARTSGVGETETGGGWFSIYPALSLDYQIANTGAFLGVDSRVLFIAGAPDSRDPSLCLFAVGGLRF